MGNYHDLLTLAEKQINLQVTSLHQYHIKHKKNDNTINVLILHMNNSGIINVQGS